MADRAALTQALANLIKWHESEEVRRTFDMAGMLSVTHRHLAVPVSDEFAEWAMSVWAEARAALAGPPEPSATRLAPPSGASSASAGVEPVGLGPDVGPPEPPQEALPGALVERAEKLAAALLDARMALYESQGVVERDYQDGEMSQTLTAAVAAADAALLAASRRAPEGVAPTLGPDARGDRAEKLAQWSVRVELSSLDPERRCEAATNDVFDTEEDARARYEALATLSGWRDSPPVAGASVVAPSAPPPEEMLAILREFRDAAHENSDSRYERLAGRIVALLATIGE